MTAIKSKTSAFQTESSTTLTLMARIRLVPTPAQNVLLSKAANEYISLVNDILDYANAIDQMPKLTSAMVNAPLPSTVRNECCRVAKSLWRKCRGVRKSRIPVLKKPVLSWNNQNFKVFEDHLEFPLLVNGKSERVQILAFLLDKQFEKLKSAKRFGSLRVTQKNGVWYAFVPYDVQIEQTAATGVMGVDLGIKCPAVCACDNGKIKFFGNGRRNKVVRRRFASKRRKLQKQKKTKALERLEHKEQNFMKDVDHKLSREIVNFAVANGVGVIKLETLTHIRKNIFTQAKGNSKPARKSRKNNREKSSWSFRRLADYIEYKANLEGIKVEYIDPAYTSQACPHCGALNHASDRRYVCSCGYHSHRDLVGARNILAS